MNTTLFKSKRITENFLITITYILLISGAFVISIPFLWMVSTSLKAQMDVFLFPPRWIPDPPQWQNYREVFTIWPFLRYTWNSFFIAILSIIGKLIASSLGAYGFARLRAKGKDLLFLIYLSTMMLPDQVTLIPQFILFRQVGWVNTFLPLIVPSFFLGPFFTFLLRQFFMTIPYELEDAARIDGCSTFQIFYRIMAPLSLPALAIVGIFEFRARWNDFLTPLIYLDSPNNRTIALALKFFQGSDTSSPQLHLLMAASFLSVIPILILFTIAQRRFIQGIVFTGVKG
jgi:multiple sugar transport system permease protein/sn-glycerol 3-phosphate transport system permease protein